MNYEETQKGGVIVIAMVIALAVVLMAFLLDLGASEFSSLGFFVVTISFMIVYGLFSSLITTVDSKEIQLKFGVGIIKKTIDLGRIKSVSVVKNKWYYGWGIRYYGQGWMWNFSGLEAVELEMKDAKMKFRIGSKDAEKLKLAIEQNLT